MLLRLQFLCTQKVSDLKEQHICIKFCFKLGKNTVETFDMFEVRFRSENWKGHKFCLVFQVQE